jgi:glycosyltransferase involved in cell wall biosynthesis
MQWSLLIPALRQAGFDVSVLTLVHEGALFDQLRASGISATCVGMRHRTDLPRLLRALYQARAPLDLVVTQSINADVVGHAIARKVRAAHVVTEHAGPGPGARRTAHRAALARIIAPRVDRAIAVSGAQIPTLVDLGYRRERIRIIRNAVADLAPTESRAVVRAQLGLPVERFLAVLVATVRPEKNVDVFIRGVQLAHHADSRITGLVVGGGSELERLRRLVDDKGAVRLTGHRSDVPDLLHAADAVCLSSSQEASPMALLEGMAAGKPIVATDVGGVPEAVENEKTGLLVPIGDSNAFASALLRLAADPVLAARMGRAGRERQRTLFSLDRMVSDYTELFEDVLAERRSRPST